MSELGNRIIEGLEEAVEFMKGEETGARSTQVVIEEADVDVKEIRTALGQTQKGFAERFGFSVHTIRGWEQGQRQPETSAKLLLMMIRDNPAMVDEYLTKLRAGESGSGESSK